MIRITTTTNAIAAPKKDEIKESFLKLTDSLTAEQAKSYLNLFESGELGANTEIKALVTLIVTRRWKKVTATISSPTEASLQDARLCRSFDGAIGSDTFDHLLSDLLKLDDVAALKVWEGFIHEEIRRHEKDSAVLALDACLANLKSESMQGDTRIFYGELLIQSLEHFDVSFGMPYFKKLFQLLTSEDAVIAEYALSKSEGLVNRYGNEIPRSLTDERIADLLGRPSLAPYPDSVDFLLRFSEFVHTDTLELAVKRVITELANESLDVSHRKVLLQLLTIVGKVPLAAADLSEVLYKYKEGGAVDELKGKSWEVYDLLTSHGLVPSYNPPPEPIAPDEMEQPPIDSKEDQTR